MYTAKLSLKLSAKIDYDTYQDDAFNIIYQLIHLFVKNGQIADSHNRSHFKENNRICVIVNPFNYDSLDKKYHNRYIKETLSKLKKNDFKIQILGKELESPNIGDINKTDALILTTRCYSAMSPQSKLGNLTPFPFIICQKLITIMRLMTICYVGNEIIKP